ncbi:MAG TPA: hypothetical protein VGG83_13915 [Trebonia sp.]|jgi:uncharacterized protein YukE
MALEGMDLDAVTPVLTVLSNAVNELQTILTSTGNAYSTIEASWKGPDAQQFQSQWPSFVSALTTAHTDLTTLHTHLQSNYTAQQSASTGY